MIKLEDIQIHIDHVVFKRDFLKNHKICSNVVFEKGLSNYLDRVIKKEYPKSHAHISERKTPTNYYESFVNKVSKTHAFPPTYGLLDDTTLNETESKKLNTRLELCQWHNKMIWAQRTLNTHCSLYVEPYTSPDIDGPCVRAYRGHEFEAWSNPNSPEPNIPDVIIKFLSSGKDIDGHFQWWESVDKDSIARYKVRTGSHADMLIGHSGTTHKLDLESITIRDNPMKEIPGEYVQQNPYGLKGDPDVELLLLTKVANTNVADLNFTFKFTHHPVRISKNLQLPEGEQLDFNPDKVIETKTRRGDNGNEPAIETIYTQVAYQESFDFNQNNIVSFFVARGAALKMDQPSERPMSAAVADMSMFDLTAIWEQQKSLFTGFEKNLLRKFIKYSNIFANDFEDKSKITEKSKVEIVYSDSQRSLPRSTRVDNALKELKGGLTTKRKAVGEVNPRLGPTEVDKLVEEIEREQPEPIETNETDQENETTEDINGNE